MKTILYAAALTIGLGIANNVFAWGSLAIDNNQGRAYGLSYDYPTAQEADARALKECGYGCQVVKNFATGCGAYAADQSYGSTTYGWGLATTGQEAQDIALNYCRQSGGANCMIRVWSCNSY
jgi:hypothetical protein